MEKAHPSGPFKQEEKWGSTVRFVGRLFQCQTVMLKGKSSSHSAPGLQTIHLDPWHPKGHQWEARDLSSVGRMPQCQAHSTYSRCACQQGCSLAIARKEHAKWIPQMASLTIHICRPASAFSTRYKNHPGSGEHLDDIPAPGGSRGLMDLS